MIRSVVDRQPSLLLCKGCPMMIKRLRGGIYHTSTLARVITCWWCCCVLLWSIFLFFPRVHQLMCCCCDDQLPLWRHTSPLNCDDRCDNGWLLMQSYQAIWWCVDVLIMRWSNIMWFTIKLLHWNINHTSVVTEANNFFPLFSSLDLKHFHVLSILKRF